VPVQRRAAIKRPRVADCGRPARKRWAPWGGAQTLAGGDPCPAGHPLVFLLRELNRYMIASIIFIVGQGIVRGPWRWDWPRAPPDLRVIAFGTADRRGRSAPRRVPRTAVVYGPAICWHRSLLALVLHRLYGRPAPVNRRGSSCAQWRPGVAMPLGAGNPTNFVGLLPGWTNPRFEGARRFAPAFLSDQGRPLIGRARSVPPRRRLKSGLMAQHRCAE